MIKAKIETGCAGLDVAGRQQQWGGLLVFGKHPPTGNQRKPRHRHRPTSTGSGAAVDGARAIVAVHTGQYDLGQPFRRMSYIETTSRQSGRSVDSFTWRRAAASFSQGAPANKQLR